MKITSNNSLKLEKFYKLTKDKLEIKREKQSIESKGVLYDLITNKDLLSAIVEIVKYSYLAYVAYLKYKVGDKEEKELIDAEILKDPTSKESQEKIKKLEEKKDITLHLEFKK